LFLLLKREESMSACESELLSSFPMQSATESDEI
jgi:hypothetical protein